MMFAQGNEGGIKYLLQEFHVNEHIHSESFEDQSIQININKSKMEYKIIK